MDDDADDNDGDEEEESPKIPSGASPHSELNKRELISQKLLNLYESVNDSINDIMDGTNFENKPVKLMKLRNLSETVKLLIETINKETDDEVTIMKYALAVRVYSSIIDS
jgi:hypothetical protein